MGMPIDNYNIFRVLAKGGEYYEMDAVRQALSPFNLFAFILHDPEKNPVFHRFLSDSFDWLDYLTGEKLLFFALVDPPEAWLDQARNRPYYQQLSWFTKEVLNPNNYPKTSEPSLSAYALAKTLGIDYQDLPCIILTDDFQKPEFYWLKTNRSVLHDQLAEIGFRSSRMDSWNLEKQHLNNSFLRFISSRMDFRNLEKQPLNDKFARIIFDDLSVMLVNQHQYSDFAADQSHTVVSQLFASLEENRLNQNLELFEQIAEKLFLLLGLASKARLSDINQLRAKFLPISPNYLEHESEIILRTGLRVLHLLQNEENPLDPVLEETWDYSPGIVSMAKLFEREINLSIVHFMRDLMNVDLPRYYDKVQPNLSPQPRINHARLNAEKGGKWLPPALGQSKYAFEDLINQNQFPPGWTVQACQTLYDYWDIIHHHRNPAAHSSLTSYDSLMEVIDALRNLNADAFFEKFFRLKTLYRGQ